MSRTLAILSPVAKFPGIYLIVCQRANLCYVGQTSRTIAARWKEHWALLQYGRHPNDKMQAAWKQYGGAAFEVAILEVVKNPKLLDARERFWIKRIGQANER